MKETYKVGTLYQNLTNEQLREIASEVKDIYYTVKDGIVYEAIYDLRKPSLEAIVYQIRVDRLAYLNVISLKNKRPLSETEKIEHSVLKKWYHQLFPSDDESAPVVPDESNNTSLEDITISLIKHTVETTQTCNDTLSKTQIHKLDILSKYLQSLN